jgi:hypothetical protein
LEKAGKVGVGRGIGWGERGEWGEWGRKGWFWGEGVVVVSDRVYNNSQGGFEI